MWQLFLMFIVTTIAGELLRPKQKFGAPNPSALGDFQFPTAEYGRPVPVVYGECHLKGPNVVWFGDLKTTAITEKVKTGWFSSDTVTKGYKYHMGAQLVFCKGFSSWELQHGSGLVEFRFDETKRPTAIDPTPARKPGGLLVPPNTAAGGARYEHTNINASDPNAMFARVNIVNESLFGGPDKEGGFSGVVDFHYGQPGAVQNDYLQRVFGTADIPAYRGYAHAVLRQCYVGTTTYPKPMSAVVRRYPWFWSTFEGWQVGLDANPVAVVVDLMTNDDYGLGIPLAQIGASFKEAAMTCFAEGSGVSMVFDTANSAKDQLSEVLRHVDGTVYTDPATGLYEIALARDDYDLDTCLELDPDNVISLEMSRPSWGETKNTVRIKYTNAEANYAASVVEQQNLSNIYARCGVKDEETYQFMGLSSTAAANKLAARVLRTVSFPLARFSITATRAAYALRPGSVFSLHWPDLGIDGMACRVTRISYGNLTEPAVTIEAVEDIFGTMDTAFVAPPQSAWTEPVQELAANSYERLAEVPFHLAGGEQRLVMSLASRSNYLAQGYKVVSNPNGVMVQTNSVPEYTPSGSLKQAYGAATAAIDEDGFDLVAPVDLETVEAIAAERRLTGEHLLLVDDELMTFTGIRQNIDGSYRVYGVVRGVLDTLPADHSAGARAWLVSSGAGLLQANAYPADQTLLVKLLPFDNTRQLDEASVSTLTASTTSRALKPYPPGRLRVEPQPNGDLVFSWAHRPRRQMLAEDRFVDRDYDGYATGEGSYTVQVKVGGVVKQTLSAITGKSVTYTKAQRLADSSDASLPVTFAIQARDGDFYSAEQETAPVVM